MEKEPMMEMLTPTRESQRRVSPPSLSTFNYKNVTYCLLQAGNPLTCKPHKRSVLTNHFLPLCLSLNSFPCWDLKDKSFFHSPQSPRNTTHLFHFVLGRSVVSDSLRPHGLQPTRLLCPWGFSRPESWSGLPFPSPLFPFGVAYYHPLHLQSQKLSLINRFFRSILCQETNSSVNPKYLPGVILWM